MRDLQQLELWFVTGSQDLYGEEPLKQVEANSREIVGGLNQVDSLPVKLVFKPVVTTADAITRLCLEANLDQNCIGLVTWMHTFSPAKMWINGLKSLQKPLVHLHTQFNQDIPWQEMDMDFMNLNQSAHGGREYGHMVTRLGIDRRVIVGHWQDERVQTELSDWERAALGWHEMQNTKIARFGDNMRNVAVTDGDKVAAQMQFGYTVDGFGIGDLVNEVNSVSEADIKQLLNEYDNLYSMVDSLKPNGQQRQALVEQARMELGMKQFLSQGGYTGFTTNFETLDGLPQLPGFAVQRLMAQGFGFGAEGDWKTAALLRVMKVMAIGLDGGTSFMEDYTYNLTPGSNSVLGSHMLEVCESIAKDQPRLEIHPLSMGGKADPVRSIFTSTTGPAINVTIVDLGDRFRMIINEVEAIEPQPLPKLPVARALWVPKPDLPTAAAAWILAGGAHHTTFTQALTTQNMLDLAEIAGVEALVIDANTNINEFKKEMRWNQAYYQ